MAVPPFVVFVVVFFRGFLSWFSFVVFFRGFLAD